MAKTLKADKKSILELLAVTNKFPGDKVGTEFDKFLDARRALKKPIRKYLDEEIDKNEEAQDKINKIYKEQIAPLKEKIQALQKLAPLSEDQTKNLNALSTQAYAYESEQKTIRDNVQYAMQDAQDVLVKQKGEVVFDHESFSFLSRVLKENASTIFTDRDQHGAPFVNYDLAEKILDLLTTVE